MSRFIDFTEDKAAPPAEPKAKEPVKK
jgi:hypothetical protein